MSAWWLALCLVTGVAVADETEKAPSAVADGRSRASSAPGKPTPPDHLAARPRARGSLYSDAQFLPLTADRRKLAAGDALTILVYENTSATSSADTGTHRDSDVGVGISLPSSSRRAAISANNEFAATGRTQRTGRVLAQLTVSVREVLPNGDLLVGGEQVLEINGEKQTIRAEGRVRPLDISEQNTVLSSRLADARLTFSGEGVLGGMQRPSWWQRLLGLMGI